MKICSYIFIFLFLISCDKNKQATQRSVDYNDSISFYFKKLNRQTLTNSEQKFYLKKSLSLIKDVKVSKNKSILLDSLVNYCYLYNDRENYDKSSKLLLENSNITFDSLYLPKAYKYRGNHYFNKGILDSSYIFYLKAEKIYTNNNLPKELAQIYLKKGNVQIEINDYFGADLSLRKGYRLLLKLDDFDKRISTLNSLGLVSRELKDLVRSKEYFKEAIDLIKEKKIVNIEHPESICLNNLGMVYDEMKNYQEAIKCFNTALNTDIKINNPILYSSILNNLSNSKIKINDLKNISNILFESLNIIDSTNDIPKKIDALNLLSKYYSTIGDETNAIKYSNLALQTAKQSKNPFNVKAALEQASKVDKNNASNYSQEYIRISDSLQIVERKNADRFARIELETDELRQQYFELEERNREIMNYLLGVFLIGGIFFFLRIQRARSREVNLKQAQVEANEEIYRLMISHQHQIDEGRDLEKKRISRELHDGLLGRLFGLRLNLEGLNKFDDDEAIQTRQEYLDELKIIEQDLRDISHELNRENIVLINNFETILNNLLESQAKSYTSARLSIQIDQSIDWELLNNTAKINLYRILQESLQNINKYAKAKNVTVSFRKDVKGNLHFTVEDDGVGFNAKLRKNKGIGIENIIERVQACNGEIDIISEKGKGSKILIIFPFDNESIKI